MGNPKPQRTRRKPLAGYTDQRQKGRKDKSARPDHVTDKGVLVALLRRIAKRLEIHGESTFVGLCRVNQESPDVIREAIDLGLKSAVIEGFEVLRIGMIGRFWLAGGEWPKELKG